MSRARTCWLFGLTMSAIFTLAACAPSELPGDTALITELPPTSTEAQPLAPEASPSPPRTTMPSPEPSPTVAAYPYPALTPLPSFTAVPTPTPIVLPPLPTFAPPGPFSGMKVLYTNSQSPGYRLINVDGANETRLPPWWQSEPLYEQLGGPISEKVSPVGKKVVYAFTKFLLPEEVDLPTSIWTTAADGSDSKLLVTYTNEWFPNDPIWSPDGQWLAYRRSYYDGSFQYGLMTHSHELWIMDANGGNQRMVLDGPVVGDIEGGTYPIVFRWMHNGYIYFATHSKQLYALNPFDGNLHLLMSNVDALDLYSTLSPDGQHVVAWRELPASSLIPAGLIPVEVPDRFENWSLNGQDLVCSLLSADPNSRGIWKFNVLSGEKQKLSSNTEADVHGLSPDGKFLAYQTNEGLYIQDITTGEYWLTVSDPHDPVNGSRAIDFVNWMPVP